MKMASASEEAIKTKLIMCVKLLTGSFILTFLNFKTVLSDTGYLADSRSTRLNDASPVDGIVNHMTSDSSVPEIVTGSKLMQPKTKRKDIHTDSAYKFSGGFDLGISTLYSRDNDSIPAEIISESCQVYLQFFSTSVAEFMRCSIKNSRPLKFCGKCVNEYTTVVNDYNAIMKDEERDSSGTKCRDVILNADRIQIIVQIYDFILGLWSQSYCSACFEKHTNLTVSFKKTEEVLKFEELSNETISCMANVSGSINGSLVPAEIFVVRLASKEISLHQSLRAVDNLSMYSCDENVYLQTRNFWHSKIKGLKVNVKLSSLAGLADNISAGGTIIPLQPYKLLNVSNCTAVCKQCAIYYEELNNLYERLEDESKNKVCMDIVDSMNYTRLLWSRDFHCSKKNKELIPVFLLTFFLCVLPIIFYVGTKVHGVKQEKIILQQKRMRNMTSSSNSSTNDLGGDPQ